MSQWEYEQADLVTYQLEGDSTFLEGEVVECKGEFVLLTTGFWIHTEQIYDN